MTVNTLQRLLTVLLFSIIVAQIAHAQAFPWSVQTQQIIPNRGAPSFGKIDAPNGDTMNVMALGIGSIPGAMDVVCRTTNSGVTWDAPFQRYSKESQMNDLSHPTPKVAVIVGDTMYRDTGITIFYTHDGGDTWLQGWCDSCTLGSLRFPLWRVSMCDSMNGLLTGPAYLIARTTDGGATWRRIPDPTNGEGQFFGLQCLSPSTYILNTGSTYRTTDSGRTWTHDILARGTHRFDFIDSLNGWASGHQGDSVLHLRVTRTTDGGRTWDTLFNAPALSWRDDGLQSIAMADATHGITIGSGGTWLYTTNGTTWSEGPNLDSVVFNKRTINLASVTYPHPDKAWAAGPDGYILVYQPRTAAAPIVPGVTAATLTAFPNPAIAGAPVSITLPHITPGTDRAKLSLVDVRGATVATIEQPITNSATMRFAWPFPAEIPAGVYFLRLIDGAAVTTARIVVLK
jgi:photosystem II stability/assembly factor-like uncharacterized protein